MTRRRINDEDIDRNLELFKEFLKQKIKEKGNDDFISTHEGLGVITEEYYELVDAIKGYNNTEIVHESLDLMVSSFWLVCSLS